MSGFRSIFRSPVPHICNEQIKLTADMLNNLGTAFIIGGFITPFILQPAVTTVVRIEARQTSRSGRPAGSPAR